MILLVNQMINHYNHNLYIWLMIKQYVKLIMIMNNKMEILII